MDNLSKTYNRPRKISAELVALVHQRHEEWWPEETHLAITRFVEHDWIAVADPMINDDFVRSVGRTVAELRLRNAWSDY